MSLQLYYAAGIFVIENWVSEHSERLPLSEVLEKSEYSGKLSPWNWFGK